MNKRRGFLKALVALPIAAKAATISAEPVEPESNVKVICPHCFDLGGRGHMCAKYAAWKLENES